MSSERKLLGIRSMSDTSASMGSRRVNAFAAEAGNGLFARTECFIGESAGTRPVQPERKNGIPATGAGFQYIGCRWSGDRKKREKSGGAFCLMTFCDDDLCQAYSNSHMLSLERGLGWCGRRSAATASACAMAESHASARRSNESNLPALPAHNARPNVLRRPLPAPLFPHDSLDLACIPFHMFHGPPPVLPRLLRQGITRQRRPFNLRLRPCPSPVADATLLRSWCWCQ